jgi:hypothetical protein
VTHTVMRDDLITAVLDIPVKPRKPAAKTKTSASPAPLLLAGPCLQAMLGGFEIEARCDANAQRHQ